MSSNRTKRRKLSKEVQLELRSIRKCEINDNPTPLDIIENSVVNNDIPIVAYSESSNNQDSSTEVEVEQQNLAESLSLWSCSHNITQAALSDLLKLIEPHVQQNLPKDSRTLLKTKTNIN